MSNPLVDRFSIVLDQAKKLGQTGCIVRTADLEMAVNLLSIQSKASIPSYRGGSGSPRIKRCQECDGIMKLRTGKYGDFYGCSNYPECSYKERVDD